MLEGMIAFVGWFGITAVTGSMFAAAAFAGGRWLVDKWLSNRFAKEMEIFKSAQAHEIERLKFQIGSLLDRTNKLHQREFEILPEVWSSLLKYYVEVRSFVNPLQTHPDIGKMDDQKFEEFLAESFLKDWQKREIRSSPDKLRYFIQASGLHHDRLCESALREYRTLYLRHSIFLPDNIVKKIDELENLINAAYAEHSVNLMGDTQPRSRVEISKLWKDGQAALEAVKMEIRARFWASNHHIEL